MLFTPTKKAQRGYVLPAASLASQQELVQEMNAQAAQAFIHARKWMRVKKCMHGC
jgi:hypothetical protein